MKLEFFLSSQKNSVRDKKMIGKKWIYLEIPHRQSVDHLKRRGARRHTPGSVGSQRQEARDTERLVFMSWVSS